jgi:hypothetical protein
MRRTAEAAELAKRRFAKELWEVRRRTIADKRRAAQEALAPVRNTKPARKRFYRSNRPVPAAQKEARPLLLETGGSKHFTGASFAKDLRAWWISQGQFRRQKDLAENVGVNPKAVSDWLASKKFPRARSVCDSLREITGLECFSREGRKAARREHRRKKVQR